MNEEEIHLKLLAKSESAKDCGEMTVIKIGFVPAIIEEIVKHSQQQLLESLELELEKMKVEPLYVKVDDDGTIDESEAKNETLEQVKALIQNKKEL